VDEKEAKMDEKEAEGDHADARSEGSGDEGTEVSYSKVTLVLHPPDVWECQMEDDGEQEIQLLVPQEQEQEGSLSQADQELERQVSPFHLQRRVSRRYFCTV
jgi:hypothetical protein